MKILVFDDSKIDHPCETCPKDDFCYIQDTCPDYHAYAVEALECLKEVDTRGYGRFLLELGDFRDLNEVATIVELLEQYLKSKLEGK